MKKIAIIPARGGSKRIPRKNIKPFFGKPVIAYAIELTRESKLFERVIVSTDDDEIAKISKLYGAEVPFMRSAENSSDNASTFDVLKEVLQWFKDRDELFEVACCIYPVSPLLKIESIENSFKRLISGNYDSVVPIAPFSHPIQRALSINTIGEITIVNPNDFKKNTQDLSTFYHDTGQFYWFKTKNCLEVNTLISNNSICYTMNNNEVQDVDNQEDWENLEFKFLKSKNE
jgi:pseudaminic acid cytidylyltransferase